MCLCFDPQHATQLGGGGIFKRTDLTRKSLSNWGYAFEVREWDPCACCFSLYLFVVVCLCLLSLSLSSFAFPSLFHSPSPFASPLSWPPQYEHTLYHKPSFTPFCLTLLLSPYLPTLIILIPIALPTTGFLIPDLGYLNLESRFLNCRSQELISILTQSPGAGHLYALKQRMFCKYQIFQVIPILFISQLLRLCLKTQHGSIFGSNKMLLNMKQSNTNSKFNLQRIPGVSDSSHPCCISQHH